MLTKMFQRLTADPTAEMALFGWITRTARRQDFYVDGSVPDTIDGRFAMLSTIAALVCVRLERLGEAGDQLSVALTERFAQVMESEHRELGLGDPTLGKTVLKLVGALARRVGMWRQAQSGEIDWDSAVRASLPEAKDPAALRYRTALLKDISESLNSATIAQLAAGDVP
ncbi:MAG: ubiquinol-cytochrome C chaperone family protein [Sphingomicrobium sp.]